MIPSAMYDLNVRISAASAVASCALMSLPAGSDAYGEINHVGNLIAAMQDLLKLAAQDAEEIERRLTP
jgi:hypothetical protein